MTTRKFLDVKMTIRKFLGNKYFHVFDRKIVLDSVNTPKLSQPQRTQLIHSLILIIISCQIENQLRSNRAELDSPSKQQQQQQQQAVLLVYITLAIIIKSPSYVLQEKKRSEGERSINHLFAILASSQLYCSQSAC
jgi:hypothetical protein